MQAHRSEIKNLGRLKKRSDFLLAGSQGRKWVSKSVIVQIVAQAPQDGTDARQAPAPHRFGITATARSVGNAVERARVKRRLRAAMRDVYAGRPLAPGWDIVLIGRKETLTADYKALVGDIGWCLKRLGLAAGKMPQGDENPARNADDKAGA